MNKDILFTALFCALYLMSSANGRMIEWSPVAGNSVTCFFSDTVGLPKIIFIKESPGYLVNDSVVVVFNIITGPCRQFDLFQKSYEIKPVQFVQVRDSASPKLVSVISIPKRKLFHGDVSYDYSTHASPDTSFVGNRFTQHHLLVNLNATIAKRYPVILHFGTLQTSLPYVKDYVDVSLQFDHKEFNSLMIDQFMGRIRNRLREADNYDSLVHNEVVRNFHQTQALSGWLNSDKQVQQLIYSNSVLSQYAQSDRMPDVKTIGSKAGSLLYSGKDSVLANTLGKLQKIKSEVSNTSVRQALADKAEKIKNDSSLKVSDEKLRKAMDFIREYYKKLSFLKDAKARQDSLQSRYDSLRSLAAAGKDSLEQILNHGEAGRLVKEYGDTVKDNPLLRFLMGVKQLTLGRTYIDYSQLSAKNISLMGFNMEYCNRYYFALAAGKTDFRYLDFLSVSSVPNQYLLLGRFGVGEKEGRHLYFTAYTGRKQTSYYVENKPATNRVTGLTLETRVPLNKNFSVTGEIAKSSYPAFIASAAKPGKLFTFSDRSNEAYSLQLTGYFPRTDTRVYGVYNRLGIYFQSFNIFNNNANSSAWQVRLDQYLLKKKLLLSASARQNDYSTPLLSNNYKSQSLFYSFQASLRIRKWPVLTVGFLPYAQITRMNGELSLSRFYTVMGSANYAYRVHQLYMATSLVYTRYFSSSNQTGFLFYDAQSWFLNHSLVVKKFTLSGAATLSYSPGYSLFSAGPGIQWRISNMLELGGGIKYNDLNHREKILGFNGNINLQIGSLGRIGVSFERGYIPGISNGLFQNDWGRATYNKNF